MAGSRVPGLVMLCCFVGIVLGQPRTDPPACWSTTEEYINRNLVINVLPTSSVLIQRLRGPELKIFCISFTESGPACANSQTTSVPELCWRRVDQPSAAFECVDLGAYPGNPNHNEVRGSINGPDIIWDIKWKGSQLPASCFPRLVEVRMLAFVRGAEVSSTAIFIILLFIVILTAILVMIAFGCFIRQRAQQVDDAGAVTVGGPKADFRGPQMALTAPIALAQNTNTKYLPVSHEHGATADMTSSKYGEMTRQGLLSNTPFSGRKGPGDGRKSPPRPGDGVPGGPEAFRGARRPVNQPGGDGDPDGGSPYGYDDDGGYSQNGNSTTKRRRPHGRGGRGGGGDGRTGALFPTQGQWQVGTDKDQHIFYDENGEPINPNRHSMGHSGPGMQSPLGADGTNRQRVKFIPQWMQGSFGKGGVIPDAGDGTSDVRYTHTSGSDTETGERSTGRQGSRTFGVYDKKRENRLRARENIINRNNSKRSGKYSDDERGGNRYRRRGTDGSGYDSSGPEDAYSGPRAHRLSPERNRSPKNRHGRQFHGGAGGDENADNFNRNTAKVFSSHLQVEDPDALGGDRSRLGGGGAGSDKENTGPDGLRGVSYRNTNPTATQCSSCKVLLGPGAPVFCKVSGERHQ